MRIGLAVVVSAAMALAAEAAQAKPKPTIVLVHGAFETAAVWKPVEKTLRADGYRTVAVNLPGRTGNPHAPGTLTLDAYRDAVLDKIAHEKRPIVLVGHSFGGFTISSVAEAAPAKIRTLVYVAAYLPKSGDSLLSLSGTDKDSRMGPAFRVMQDKGLASVDPAQRSALFCNGCTDAQKALVEASFVDEPLPPPATPVAVTAAKFGSVDKVYIHTRNDVVVSPALQTAMVQATPVRQELSLDTGHAPFAAAPDALAKAIEAAIR